MRNRVELTRYAIRAVSSSPEPFAPFSAHYRPLVMHAGTHSGLAHLPASRIGPWFNSPSAASHVCLVPAADELEQWLEQQVDALRAQAPHANHPAFTADPGPAQPRNRVAGRARTRRGRAPPRREPRLTGALRDMRLLGLQPTLLAPLDLSRWSDSRGDNVTHIAYPQDERSRAVSVDQMSESSFPASDPPAVWTWEVAPQTDRRHSHPDASRDATDPSENRTSGFSPGQARQSPPRSRRRSRG